MSQHSHRHKILRAPDWKINDLPKENLSFFISLSEFLGQYAPLSFLVHLSNTGFTINIKLRKGMSRKFTKEPQLSQN